MSRILRMSSPVHLAAWQSDLHMCGASVPLLAVDNILLSNEFSEAFLEHCRASWKKLIKQHLCSGFMHEGKAYIDCTLPLVTFRHCICDELSIKGRHPRIHEVLSRLYVETSGWRALGVDEIKIAAIELIPGVGKVLMQNDILFTANALSVPESTIHGLGKVRGKRNKKI